MAQPPPTELAMATGVSPQPVDEQASIEMAQLNPHIGSNLPMYPAMPQPRQLSAYDPEWEEDPHFLAASRKTATLQAQSKTLPSPAVLRDILSELTERQRSEEREAAAANAPAASDGPTHLRYLGTSTSMTFEGEMDAVRAVVDADVGRRTRTGGLTAAMASVVPEPDLVRVNAGTGPQLQLDSVWVSAEASKPAGGDEALYGAPLLATMGGYRPEAYPEALAKRRVMNLVHKEEPSQPARRQGSGTNAERTVVFRSKKDMYEPRARQLLSAEEEAEFLADEASMEAAVDAGGGVRSNASSPRVAASEDSAASEDIRERHATLRAAAESPGVNVSFDLTQNKVRAKGQGRRQQRAPEPAPAPRMPFAERFRDTLPSAAVSSSDRAAAEAAAAASGDAADLPAGMNAAVTQHLSPRVAESTTSGASGDGAAVDVSAAGAAAAPAAAGTAAPAGGSPTRITPELGESGGGGHIGGGATTGPYRLSRGGTRATMAAGGLDSTPSSRRQGTSSGFGRAAPRTDRFDVRGWADDQRRAAEAPTLRHFYSDIRTVH